MPTPKSLISRLALLMTALALAGCCSTFCKHKCEGPEVGEAPFRVRPDSPGPAIVQGTADFSVGGVVQVKIQVNAASVPNTEDAATITAWAGNGNTRPGNTANLPPSTTAIFDTSNDVTLPYWTVHLTRNWDDTADRYWVVVRVDREGTSGNPRVVSWHWFEWGSPSPLAPLDSPHDFSAY